jgi:hypothetical protein
MKSFVYLIFLLVVAVHLYRTPVYDMDLLGYMGNALLYKTQDVRELHRLVYSQVKRLPNATTLLGASDNAEQNVSRKARAEHPEYFAEFLPCFAIRPLYNSLLYALSPLGLPRAAILISVVSYVLTGWLVFLWTDSALPSLLLMLSAPLLTVGRSTMSDSLALVIAVGALFLLFRDQRIFSGVLLLLLSLFARTDLVVLVVPVLGALWFRKELKAWQASVLGFVAILSVLVVNHFAGDYGLQMLYYRSLVVQPIAPGEMTASFSFAQYLSAFQHGLSLAAESFLPLFLALGFLGWRKSPELILIGLAYAVLHYVAFPSWQERFFVLSYVLMVVACFGRRSRYRLSLVPALRRIRASHVTAENTRFHSSSWQQGNLSEIEMFRQLSEPLCPVTSITILH